MTSPKSRPLPEKTAGRGTLSLEQLIDAHRPLLFGRMPRMLRGDGTVAGSLQQEHRFFRALHPDHAPVSARRWKAALLRSRILRGHRRRVNRAQ
jgi:hypothetical protein